MEDRVEPARIMLRLIAEIKRRRVIPVAAYYIVGFWLVLQAADILMSAWGVSPRAVQLIVYAALLGFPVALVFGWRYDLGPDGISRTPPAEAAETPGIEIKLERKDFLLLGILLLAVAALGVWLVERLMQDDPLVRPGSPNSIAVLAFEDTDEDGGSLAMDLADQLVSTLISIDGLKVTGRESSFYFAGRSSSLEHIAGMLAVALNRAGGSAVRAGVLSGMILNTTRNRPAIGWDGIGLRAARVYALQGEAGKAIEAFRMAFSQGFRWIYEADALLPLPIETLLGQPDFDQLIDEVEAEMVDIRVRSVDLVQSR